MGEPLPRGFPGYTIPLSDDNSSTMQGANNHAKSLRDEMVKVDDYRLHFRVVDGLHPTIVLESGGAELATQWSDLQPTIAAATGRAVVSYDRAGY